MIELLAKSRNARGEALSLLQHLIDVEQAVHLVFAEGSRWRRTWLRFFRVPGEREAEFWRMLGVVALLHDIGKANDDFLHAVTRKGQRQSLRHEHLSALVLCTPQFRDWLAAHHVNPDMVTAAVLSHHIKAADTGDHEYAWCQSRERDRVVLHLQHPDVQQVLARVAALIGAPTVPELPGDPWTPGSPWSDVFSVGRVHAKKFVRKLKKQEDDRRVLAALKAALIVADAVASGVVREGKSMREWLAHNAHSPAVTPEEIQSAIIEPRARQVEAKRGRPFTLHAFQRLAGEEGPRTALLAPCGAGKTLAAWVWAKHQTRLREFGRVIFLYPTRGTASEGFRDYVGWAPEGDATLLHGSSAFELAGIADNPPEALAGKDISKAEAEARMFALGLWRFRFFSATVDQFLSFMQNRYQSLCLLPVLADSVVILDEVHSYDTRMFDLLLSFLEEFDVPVLCMTATLPNQRKQRLETAGLTPFPRSEHGVDLEDLAASAEHPRYSIVLEERDAALNLAIQRFRDGKRVLVVVNRVARCLEVAEQIREELGSLPLVYHSRFKLKDRQDRHGDVVAAFKGKDPAIAVTTQVCEMSLDLDAQVLVTEVAPVPSLIQRFGRANRHLVDPNALAEILVYPPAKAAPYRKPELETALDFVDQVQGVATQAQLAEALETGGFTPPEPSFGSAGLFLAGGYFAVPGSFREEDDHTTQCVCDGEDLTTVEELLRQGAPIDGYILPAPRNQTVEIPTRLPRHIGVVSHEAYCPYLGLRG